MQGGVRLLRLDVMALLERIAEDPAAAGFANLTDPCRTETAICADPARYVFWDEIHPTTAAHALLARRAAAVLAQPR
jgi:outer membrane lipase/esterase